MYDPTSQLGAESLRMYRLHEGVYRQSPEGWFSLVGLGVRLWQGVYEELELTWLRWCDREGKVIPTGAERAAAAEDQAEQAHQQAEQAHQRAERLAAQLRALGVAPQDA